MLRPRRVLLPVLSWAAILLISACGPAEGPPPVTLDRTACDHCGMLVSDMRTASALRTSDGTGRVFDDVGCMIEALQGMPELPERIWVRDAGGDRWLDAREAVFTRSRKVLTPMGSGLLAWPDDSAVPAETMTLVFEDLLREGTATTGGVR